MNTKTAKRDRDPDGDSFREAMAEFRHAGKKDVMTPGYRDEIGRGNIHAVSFLRAAAAMMRDDVDMVVGDPRAATRSIEDGGRTLRLPILVREIRDPIIECPKFYACRNETGGTTFMLADEY